MGTSRKRLGVTLSCQLELGANAHVMQRKNLGKSEMQKILALSFVKGGYRKLCEQCCRLGALAFLMFKFVYISGACSVYSVSG